jgi:hypothetical protein
MKRLRVISGNWVAKYDNLSHKQVQFHGGRMNYESRGLNELQCKKGKGKTKFIECIL